MANGASPGVRNSDERFAALDERVTNLRSSFQSLERSTSDGFGRMDAKLGEMSAAFSAGQQTPWAKIWPGVSIGVVVIGMIVSMLYWPVRADQSRLEGTLTELSKMVTASIKEGPDTYIPRREADQARARAAEDRASAADAISDLREAVSTLKQQLARVESKERP